MGAQHTPGPWVDVQFGDRPQSVSALGGAVSVCSFGVTLFKHYPQQAQANARLIAAAPDLLKALEEIVNALIEEGWTMNGHWAASARAAIAAAKGE